MNIANRGWYSRDAMEFFQFFKILATFSASLDADSIEIIHDHLDSSNRSLYAKIGHSLSASD